MPVSIVVGGQFGSEGKGKVAFYLAQQKDAQVVVRVGGTNSGHTVYDSKGGEHIFRILPTVSILNTIDCILPSGAYIDLDILFDEIKDSGLEPKKLKVDPNAVIITKEQKNSEFQNGLCQNIGSTGSGTGMALMDRISRNKSVLLAKNEPRLKEFITSTKEYLREKIDRGQEIVIEGTQGYGLSLLHAEDYPYVTSRDTTAAAFLSETGLSPLDVKDIIMVLRAFPIRVAGNSGPLLNEINWDTITSEAGSAPAIVEYTSVTKKVRRVARFDANIVRKAIITNNPNILVLNHLDYIDASITKDSWKLNTKVCNFIKDVESSINNRISFLGFGPEILVSA